MNLRQQVEEVLGRPVSAFTPEGIAAQFGLSPRDFRERLERNTRVIDVRRLLSGEDKPEHHVMFLITEHRGGFLITLRELMKEAA